MNLRQRIGRTGDLVESPQRLSDAEPFLCEVPGCLELTSVDRSPRGSHQQLFTDRGPPVRLREGFSQPGRRFDTGILRVPVTRQRRHEASELFNVLGALEPLECRPQVALLTVKGVVRGSLLVPARVGVIGEAARDASTRDAAAEDAAAGEVQAPPQPIGRPRSGFFYYTVKQGDNLSELAREFNSTMLALLEYNDLPNTDTVYAGLELRIPYGPPPLPLDLPPIPFAGSRFVVSLSRQQCWVLEANSVRYTWSCSTGYGKWITRTGNFAVQSKIEMAKSTAYELDMPFWLGIYDVGTFENGIHGLPIRWEDGQKIWEGLIGQPATFGCAMLDDEDAATLFDLAFLGMPVHIVP